MRIKIGTSEVGWLITKDHIPLEGPITANRVGYGQMLADAKETEESFERIVGRQIFASPALKVEDIPSNKRVKWRSFSDDGDPCYDGIVNVDWLFGDGDEDHAYNIDRFNIEDAGAVIVVYNAADIKRCLPGKSDYVNSHPRMQRKEWLREAGIDSESWLPIYG
jgi:hypothetical protein